ncbi:MAG: sensor histidine kinase [Planctomycetota bacterium]|jgi:signal transduction histidine kinase
MAARAVGAPSFVALPGEGKLPVMGLAVAAFVLGVVLGALSGLYRRGRRKPREPDARVAELSELAGGLAHELRNPLSTLMVNLQLLAEDLRELGDEDAHLARRSLIKVEAVRREAERLQNLLDDFLKLAGPCRLEFTSVDLNQTVVHLVEFFSPQADAAGVRLHVTYAPQPLQCRLDEGLMKQALLNILINAQEAMPDGGEIMVRISRNADKTASVEISDTGPALTPEELSKVLRPFYSTKAGGTGLGLSTTHRIVSEHGGRLDLHSEPGRGTSFTVSVPLADDNP